MNKELNSLCNKVSGSKILRQISLKRQVVKRRLSTKHHGLLNTYLLMGPNA
jgi:hypothetical protein